MWKIKYLCNPNIMRPAFHCPNGGIGRRVGLKIQCPLKTCRFEPGFGHRDRSAGNFPPPTCFFLDSISILHFSLPSPSLHPCAFSISRFYSPPLHPRVFSIIPVPTISSLHSLPYFPIFPIIRNHLSLHLFRSSSPRHKLRPFCSR